MFFFKKSRFIIHPNFKQTCFIIKEIKNRSKYDKTRFLYSQPHSKVSVGRNNPGRNNKTKLLGEKNLQRTRFYSRKFVMKKTKSNISGKIRHSILHPDGKKWKSESKEIITESRYIKIVSYAAIILLPVLFVSISMKFTSPFLFGQTVHRTIHSTWGIPSYSDIGGRPDNPYK